MENEQGPFEDFEPATKGQIADMLGCANCESQHIDKSTVSVWRAVVMQAFVDGKNASKKSEAQYHRRQAVWWLLWETNGSFKEVCCNAGLDWRYVRRIAWSLYDSGVLRDD